MLSPRAETSAVAIGSLVYVMGGFGSDGLASTRVDVYDTASDSWKAVRSLPVGLHHAGAPADCI
jgi:N-acetylneuraminic acid mutarotase